MCGIAGIVAVGSAARRRARRARRRAMRDVITHRGPDEAGLHCDAHAALAHRRLSIVDLAAGQQPLSNEDEQRLGRLQRRDLQPRRHPAASSRRAATTTARAPTPRPSSTPTSSGATPASTASAACSRSRSGTRRGGGCCSRATASASSRSTGRAPATALLFGSEIKAILASGLIEPRAERGARCPKCSSTRYTVGRGDAVQRHPQAAARPPARRSRTATSTTRRYWDVPASGRPTPSIGASCRRRDVVARFRELLEESVRLRLMATCRSACSSPAASTAARSPR